MNVLFTCAGRRNYLINYFKTALKEEGRVLAADMDKTAPAMVDADMSFVVPNIYDKDYISTLKRLISSEKINAVISLNDLELPILAANKIDLESLGCHVIVSEKKIIDTCFDKWKTKLFLERIGIRTPKTFNDLSEAKKAILNNDLIFPLVVKPRWGSASIGIEYPENMEELDLVYKLLSIRLERTILREVSSEDINHAIIIQERLIGKEYGMDVLNDFKGNYQGTFVREKLSMRAGETDKAISVIDSKIEQIGKNIGQYLKHIGNLDCDVFEQDGQYFVLEMNPRFGGGYPFSHEAGVNTAAVYIEWLKGGNDISKYINYKPGFMFSKCDRLIRVN